MKELLKNSISKKSYSDGKQYEKAYVDYLEGYVLENLKGFSVQRQRVANNRENLFITDGKQCKFLIVNHTDTVQPGTGWTVDPLQAIERDGKVFGLGSSDTKGNTASFLTALSNTQKLEGISLLLYVDEEYDFLGMKKFVDSELATKLNPEYIMSIDGTGLVMGNGCRGLIEIELELSGVTGHSANPMSGASVNIGFLKMIDNLLAELECFESESLGKPTLNIAQMQGGSLIDKNNKYSFSSQGNKIPDFLSAILEIRTIPGIDINWLKDLLKRLAETEGLRISKLDVRHELNAYETPLDKINGIYECIRSVTNNSELLDAANFGYLDLAMLTDRYPEAKIFSFGGGTNGQSHKADEYVLMKDLEMSCQVYTKILSYVQRN